MLRLRALYDVFTSGTETLSVNGVVKRIQLKLNDHSITLIGNFGMFEQTIVPNFQHTGTWYEFFTGNELTVSDVNSSILMKAGEYRLYSDQKLPAFKDLATTTSGNLSSFSFRIYPNPATDNLTIESGEMVRKVEIYSLDGKILQQSSPNSKNFNLNLNQLKPGIYFLRGQTTGQLFTEKIVKN